MPDEGPDLGYCDECGGFGEVVYVVHGPGPDDRTEYCKQHVPLVMDKEAFDMAFDKAGVPGPKRHRLFESILGILFYSKQHHQQSEIEQIRPDEIIRHRILR